MNLSVPRISLIVAGATGMIGEGVLHECLLCDQIDRVLVVGRRSCETAHPKLRELIHQDFFDLTPLEEELAGYHACLFCVGASPLAKSEDEYVKLTSTLAVTFAGAFSRRNPGGTFCYVSAKGADPSGESRQMWRRVKGRAENELRTVPLEGLYLFRPGIVRRTRGLDRAHWHYQAFDFLVPVLAKVLPDWVCTLRELGLAMIRAALRGYEKPILEVRDILALSGD
jgi:hypothetical protein